MLLNILGIYLRIRKVDRAEHEWIRGFLTGSGIYVVAPNFLNILQFFSCKSIKNWLSYASAKFEPQWLKNAAVLGSTSLFGICESHLMYLACCAVTFGLNDFKLGKGIAQSILNGFAQKKLQNVQKIRGYNVSKYHYPSKTRGSTRAQP